MFDEIYVGKEVVVSIGKETYSGILYKMTISGQKDRIDIGIAGVKTDNKEVQAFIDMNNEMHTEIGM